MIHEPDNIQTEEMDVSSTEESEIDSEGESQRWVKIDSEGESQRWVKIDSEEESLRWVKNRQWGRISKVSQNRQWGRISKASHANNFLLYMLFDRYDNKVLFSFEKIVKRKSSNLIVINNRKIYSSVAIFQQHQCMEFTFHSSYIILRLVPSTVIFWTELK